MKNYIPTGRHGILVPRFKDLVASGMGFGVALEGRFRLITHSKRYGTRVRAEFKNLILNQGLDRMAAGAAISACQVGTGTTTPAVGQTALAAFFAGSSTVGATDAESYVAGPPTYHQLVRTRRFAEGTFSGTNLTEVGMGWTATTGNLFSRALILDGGGSPTSITVLADETLDVEYTLRSYPPSSDVNGTVSLGGNSYDYTIRASNVGSIGAEGWAVAGLVGAAIGSTSTNGRRVYPSTSTLGAITAAPSGAGVTVSAVSVKSYTAGDYSRGMNMTAGLTINPAGGIACAAFAMAQFTAGGANMQMSFSPVIPKDNTKVLVLEPRIHWARR